MGAYLGDRVARARQLAGMSQRDLAAASGISLSTIRKLEQGERSSARLETVHKLAVPLGVPTSTLVASHTDDDAEQPSGALRPAQVEGIRAALHATADQVDEEPTVRGVTGAIDAALRAYARGDLIAVGAMLPQLIRDADASARLSPAGRQTRATAMQVTGRFLTLVRQHSLADAALTRAERDVQEKPHAAAVAGTRLFWMLRQGQLAEAVETAERWADEAEPRRLSRATPEELAVWGQLLLRVAAACVRDNRKTEGRHALSLAEAAAATIGRRGRPLPHLGLMREYGQTTVAMQQAEYAVLADQPDEALRISRRINLDPIPAAAGHRNRHLVNVALAQAKMRKYGEATATMLDICTAAPEWLPHQRSARDAVEYIISRRRTLTPEMRRAAEAVQLPL